MNLFERNALYISVEQQEKIRNVRVLFGGAGLGSVIAEAMVRMGFEKLTIYDADDVEFTNLNRQNYTCNDAGKSKTECLTARLKAINPNISLLTQKLFLNKDNINTLIKDCDIAINTIDFDDGISAGLFDECCRQKSIPVLHPFNFGWAGCLYILMPGGLQLFDIKTSGEPFEITVAKHTLNYLHNQKSTAVQWLEPVLEHYKSVSDKPPSQLSVGSWIVAGLTTHALFCLSNDLPIKIFPTPYFLSAG